MEKNVSKVDLDEIRLAREALNKELGITTPQPSVNKKKKEVEENPSFDDEKKSDENDLANSQDVQENGQTDEETEDKPLSQEELDILQSVFGLDDDYDHSQNFDENQMLYENDEENEENDENDIDFSVYDNFAQFEVNKEIKTIKPVVKKQEEVVSTTNEVVPDNEISDEDISFLESLIAESADEESEEEQETEDSQDLSKPKTLEEALSNITSIDDLLNMDLDAIEIEDDDEESEEDLKLDEAINALDDEDDKNYDDLISSFSDEPEDKIENKQISDNVGGQTTLSNGSAEKPVVVEKVVEVEKPVIVEKVVETTKPATQFENTTNDVSENKVQPQPVIKTFTNNAVKSTSQVNFDKPKSINVDRVTEKPIENVDKQTTQQKPIITNNEGKSENLTEAHIVSIEKNEDLEHKKEYLKEIGDYNFIDIIKSNEFMDSDELTCIYGIDEENNIVCHNFKDFYNTIIFSENDEETFKLFSSIMMSLTLKNSNYLMKYVICDAKNGSKFDVFNDLSYLFFSRIAKANSEIIDSLNELISEIDKRYENLAKASVKNIEEFNKVMKDANIMPMSYVMLFFNNYTRAIHFDDNDEINTKLHYILKYGRLVGIYVNLVSSDEKVEEKINFNFQTRISFKANSKDVSITRTGAECAEKIGYANEYICKTLFSDKVLHLKVPTISQREVELLVKNIDK